MRTCAFIRTVACNMANLMKTEPMIWQFSTF